MVLDATRWPGLAPHLKVRIAGPDTVLVQDGARVEALRGAQFVECLAGLDAGRPGGGSAGAEAVRRRVLAVLRDRGWLLERGSRRDPRWPALWEFLGSDPERTERALGGAAVEVVPGCEPLERHLAKLGVGLAAQGPSRLRVLVRPSYEEVVSPPAGPEPWLVVAVRDAAVVVGPVFAGTGPDGWCLRCVQSDLAMSWRGTSGGLPGARERLDPDEGLARLAACEIGAWLVDGPQARISAHVVRLGPSGVVATGPVRRRAYCPVCGGAGTPGGGGRVGPPGPAGGADAPGGEWAALQRFVNPVLGALDVVCRVSVPAPSPACVWTGARLDEDAVTHRVWGAGRDDLEARSQVVARALERYCRRYDEQVEADWCGRPGAVPACAGVPHGGLPDADRPLLWTRLAPVGPGPVCHVPTAAVYDGVPANHAPRVPYPARLHTASGRSPREAALEAVLGLLEARALASARTGSRRFRAVLSASFEDPFVDRALGGRGTARSGIRVVDITGGVPAPVIAALEGPDVGAGALVGIGAHPDARLALIRALCRLALAGAPGAEASRVFGWEIDSALGAARESGYRLPPLGGGSDLLDALCAQLHDQGLRAYAVDQSKAGVGLHVVTALLGHGPRLAGRGGGR